MKKYIAKKIADLNEPNAWPRIKVGVFEISDETEIQIGEYERNYKLLSTFFHFQRNGKDYALYSPHYTCTRIMELPSCCDIGGEEAHGNGFCPVEYYVPSYIEQETRWTDVRGEEHIVQSRVNQPTEEHLHERITEKDESRPLSPVSFYPFGFIAGCIWGDDSSWKIQYLDLSNVEDGIIVRGDRFGYIQMANNLTLKDAIDLCDYLYDTNEKDCYNVTIAVQRTFDLRTGKLTEE